MLVQFVLSIFFFATLKKEEFGGYIKATRLDQKEDDRTLYRHHNKQTNTQTTNR